MNKRRTMHGNRDQTRARRDYETRDGMEHSFGVLESVYSHARRAFDPPAYARNQKATSLTRVSVTHQPLKIPSGWPACLPAGRSDRRALKGGEEGPIARGARGRLISGKRLSFSENGKNSRTPVHPRRRHTSGKHLTKRSGIRFIPRGLTAAYFPASRTGAARLGSARRGARMHSRGAGWRGNGSRYPAVGSAL